MTQEIILAAIFVAVLISAYTAGRYILSRIEIARNVEASKGSRRQLNEDVNQILGSGNEQIRYYLDVVQNESPNSLRMRLVQAGFFSQSALAKFNLIRLVVAFVMFTITYFGVGYLAPAISNTVLILMGAVMAGLFFVLSTVVLEKMGKRRTREFRKLFPDFMDLLLVSVDAGLSINAAIDRVTREFLLTTPDFGIQLSIINLEIRAGRPLHEALNNFSKRIAVEEARTLAVLFKQSEELGSSVAKTLRVFSQEMRRMRLIRAEEKANALPVKMLFPMAFFMFPVNLVIVLIPILLSILQMLSSLGPG